MSKLGWDSSELHLLVQIRLDPVGKLSFLLEIPFSLFSATIIALTNSRWNGDPSSSLCAIFPFHSQSPFCHVEFVLLGSGTLSQCPPSAFPGGSRLGDVIFVTKRPIRSHCDDKEPHEIAAAALKKRSHQMNKRLLFSVGARSDHATLHKPIEKS